MVPYNRPARWVVVAALTFGGLALSSPGPAFAQSKCTRSSVANNWPNATIIQFDSGKTTLRPAEAQKIAATAKLAKSNYIQQVCVQGFADKQGNVAANQRLSLARAQAVAAQLRRNGVDPRTIAVEALGEPGGAIGGGSARLANETDRRVEIRFTR